MSNIFDIKRFWEYFVFDIQSAWKKGGINFLVVSSIPVFIFVFKVLTEFISNGSVQLSNSLEGTEFFRFTLFVIATAILVAGTPEKIYGQVTDKSKGAEWLMLPASTLEKWLSMMIIVLIVLPVAFFVLYAFFDTVIALLFPNIYGPVMFSLTQDDFGAFVVDLSGSFGFVNVTSAIWLNWAFFILVFTLGAICFRCKNKTGKTMICLIAVMAVFSSIISFYTNKMAESSAWFSDILDSPAFNTFVTIFYIVIIMVLMAVNYRKVKTLKL